MSSNPVSNQNPGPSFGAWVRQTFGKRPENETLFEIYRGAILGGLTATLATPGLYAINMRMLKEKFVFRDCLKGVLLNGANVVPQTAVQVAVYGMMIKALFPHKRGEDLTFREKVFAAAIAGGVSGAATATGEMAVLNYQRQTQAALKIREIVVKAYQRGGIPRCFVGGAALGTREMIWAPAYLSLSPAFSAYLLPIFGNKHAADILGAAFAGGIAGFLTNAPNFLRAQKQKDAHLLEKPRSYRQIVAEEGASALLRGSKIRSVVVASACIFVTEAKKALDWLFEPKQ